MMKNRIIAVDGTPLFRKFDGVGRYTARLLVGLADLNPETNFRVIAFADDKKKASLAEERPNITYIYLPLPRRVYQLLFKKFRPLAVDKLLGFRPDATLYFNFVKTPLVNSGKSIVVVHDLTYKDVPETVSDKNRVYLEQFVPWSCEQADKIIAVSTNTQTRLRIEYGYDESKIAVVEPGIDAFTKPGRRDLKAAKAKLSLPDEYVLFVGTIEPRKNLINLLRAYDMANQRKATLPRLVLVGTKGWNLDVEIHDLIQRLQANGLVTVLGYVDDQDLAAVYYQADMFVLPSLYEGFGIPLLEAMRCELPVATSNREPMDSLAPKSAPRFDPESPEQILDALHLLVNDRKLRKTVAKEGHKLAGMYTWPNSARLLTEEIEKVLKG